MSPHDAKRLTIEEALFYIRSEDDIKRICTDENSIDDKPTAEELRSQHADYMRRLREKFTGSAEF